MLIVIRPLRLDLVTIQILNQNQESRSGMMIKYKIFTTEPEKDINHIPTSFIPWIIAVGVYLGAHVICDAPTWAALIIAAAPVMFQFYREGNNKK